MLEVGGWCISNGNWTGDFPMSWLRLKVYFPLEISGGFSSQSSSHDSEFRGWYMGPHLFWGGARLIPNVW